MSGQNSGRRAGFAIRETVETLGACELRVGLATCLRQQGVVTTYSWSVAGEEVASVNLQRLDML